MEKSIASFYDDFVSYQVDRGIGKRNLLIQTWAEKFGLKQNDFILEIGCGIGTQTELLARYASAGKIIAIDISPKSIEVAASRLKKFSNVKLMIGDVVAEDFTEKFDFIVFPDVLEHIPISDHFNLFKKLKLILKDTGTILIHMPNPYFSEWCHIHRKEALQIIDQPIYTDVLSRNVYPNGLYIYYLETYSIWYTNHDYQVVVLKPYRKDLDYPAIYIKPSLWDKIIYKIKKTFQFDL